MNAIIPRQELEALAADLADSGAFVLRNADLFANLARGGDWDVLAPDLTLAENLLTHHLGPPDRLARRSYVRSYYYLWGSIDLIPSWQWRGIPLVETRTFAARLVPGPAGLPCVGAVHEAVVVWCGNLLWSGRSKEKYHPLIITVARSHPEELREALLELFGSGAARQLVDFAASGRPEAADALVRRLRRAVTVRALCRRPLAVFAGRARFVVAEARLRLRPQVPLMASVDADGILDAVEETAASIWAAVAGVVVFDSPNGCHGRTFRESVGFARQYWGPIAHARTRGIIVVLRIGPSVGTATFPARMLRRLTPPPDVVIDQGQGLPADCAGWLLGETRRRATAALHSSDGARKKAASRVRH